MRHTPRPWKADGRYCISDAEGLVVTHLAGEIPQVTERRDHVVACVNALAGLNPEAVAGLVEAARQLKSAAWHTNECLNLPHGSDCNCGVTEAKIGLDIALDALEDK